MQHWDALENVITLMTRRKALENVITLMTRRKDVGGDGVTD